MAEDVGVTGLIESLEALRQSLHDNPDEWQNVTLEAYLEAVQARLESTAGKAPAEPTWNFVVTLFSVGRIYE